MALNHGINTTIAAPSVAASVAALNGVTFAVGTAPVQKGVISNVNKIILAKTFKEAEKALGYSDDWDSFTLCEVMDAHFKQFGAAPVIFVNVLDPSTHKESVAAADVNINNKKAELPETAIKSSVVVKASGGTGSAYVLDTDYALNYSDDKLVIEVLADGAITSSATAVNVAYDKVKVSSVTTTEIIGGTDTTTYAKTGLELIENAFNQVSCAPEFIICPGYSHNATVAAAMGAKADLISGSFIGKAIIDVDASSVSNVNAAATWKTTNAVNGVNQVLCYPMLKKGNKVYHMSTMYAALCAAVDNNNGNIPSESPSNKSLGVDSVVLSSSTELLITNKDADYLNDNGIVTALNFMGNIVLWGNSTACYPTNTDMQSCVISCNRMFAYIAKDVIINFWSRLDSKLTRLLCDSIVNEETIKLNTLAADGHLLGGRIEFLEDENPISQLMQRKAKFHIYIAPPAPLEEMEHVIEYDARYFAAAFATE